ncbi:MAG: arylsulfatase [Bacteroidota bacterium]
MKSDKLICLLFATSLLIFKTSGQESASSKLSQDNARPNIIFILADDLGYGDLSFTGQRKFKTPNIDALARDGMFFNQHYSGSTVCAPSRSALLTGLHTGHSEIRGNKEIRPEGQYPIADSAQTIAEVLKMAGYATGAFGKWGLGYPGSEGDPNNQGFDEFFGYNCQRLAHNYYPYHLWENQTKIILEGNDGTNTKIYAPNLIQKKALEFIEKHKDNSFFMFYPSVIPHAELIVPDSLIQKFSGKFQPERAYDGVDSGPRYKTGGYGSQSEPRAAFAAMIYLLDKQVGEIRQKLDELGIAENTIIIFTSDNGPHSEGGADPEYFDSNGKFRGFKRDLYEGGIRVPMIVTWPKRVKPNKESTHISAFWDFFPTICDIAQQNCPEQTDGISFLPELLGESQPKHDFLYWEFHERGGKQAVRIGEWKGVRLKMTDNQKAPIELYNLKLDLGETDDVSHKHQTIVKKMDSIMLSAHSYSPIFEFRYEK